MSCEMSGFQITRFVDIQYVYVYIYIYTFVFIFIVTFLFIGRDISVERGSILCYVLMYAV